MDQTRIDSRDASAAGLFGAREEAQVPAHAHGYAPYVAQETARVRRSWLGITVRLVRNAAIAVAIMTMVPIGIVAVNGARIWNGGSFGASTRARVAQAERVRSLKLPADPSITPMQAGRAFNALQPVRDSKQFPTVTSPSRAEPVWQSATLTPDMFPNAPPNMFHGPSSTAILEAVSKGFTPREMAYLRTLASAPEWRDFDLVARAAAVDFIGGRFRIPFAPGASAEQLPIPQYKASREMAYAAVSRAAYHMAIGQRDSAEMVLRSILSFGFALMDNGTTLIDELIGNVIVGVGRDGLQRFYVITHDPRAGSPAVTQPARLANVSMRAAAGSAAPSLDDARRRLIAEVADPARHRGERFESLRMLSMSSCTNVRELMFGARTDVTDAIRDARRSLARYPSEQALADLVSRAPEPQAANYPLDPIESLARSSATVAGVVLHNPRLPACTLITGSYYYFR